MAAANPHRRTDIAAALKKAKRTDMLPLAALATVWGVSKARFVSVIPSIVDMPEPVQSGQAHLYPAIRALRAMLAHETRFDDAARRRQERTDAILGGIRKTRTKAATGPAMPVRELQVLSRLAAEVEERERAQREYIPAQEVSATVGDVFGALSEFIADLSNRVDPNGLLPPEVRAIIDNGGSEALLGFHGTLKKLLDADADPGPDRGTAGRARKPRARRARG